MKVGLWAEIRRLKEIEKLSHRAIARRLGCCAKTVKKALALARPPDRQSKPASSSLLDPYKPRIDALLAHAPELSAVRVLEEIRRGEQGYPGGISLVRRYLRKVRPPRGRIYQEVDWQPGEALQVDWGACGRIRLGNTSRRVSVFVAVPRAQFSTRAPCRASGQRLRCRVKCDELGIRMISWEILERCREEKRRI